MKQWQAAIAVLVVVVQLIIAPATYYVVAEVIDHGARLAAYEATNVEVLRRLDSMERKIDELLKEKR